jgi:hypothetical protein
MIQKNKKEFHTLCDREQIADGIALEQRTTL